MKHYYSGDAERAGVTKRQVQIWDDTGVVRSIEHRARRRIYDLDGFRRLLLTRDLCRRGWSHRTRLILSQLTLPADDCWVVTDGIGFTAAEADPLKALSAAGGHQRAVCVVQVPLDVEGWK